MRARSELAGAEHDWRVAAPPTTQSAAEAAKKRQTIAASVAHGDWRPTTSGVPTSRVLFHTGDGVRCNPFTLTDAYSRCLLSVKAVDRAGYADCRHEMEQGSGNTACTARYAQTTVRHFWPGRVGVTGLSRLAVWWLKLGIVRTDRAGQV